MSEVATKLAKLRELMTANSLTGVVFRGVDWFAWITAGGSSSVIMTSETGVADVLITLQGAWVMTSRVEDPRLREEEISGELELAVFPWQEGSAFSRFIAEKVGAGRVASDRPRSAEVRLSRDIQMLKRILVPDEVDRYRKISRLAAEAMTDVMMKAEPSWTEYELAGAGAESCWSRGLEPTLVLVAGTERGLRHRHPIAKKNMLGKSAMMVFCARASGLYANFTRFVYFDKPTAAQTEDFEKLRVVENSALGALTPGTPIRDIYRRLADTYASVGRAGEVQLHHQGGPCGYLSRDLIATPETPEIERVENGMAFAWNPSFPGAKIEDTVLCTASGVEILTVDPRWPTVAHAGRLRPDILVRA